MKLHLPKLLLTAVLAAVTLAPAAMALSITGAVAGSGYTLGDTALTNAKAYRNGQWITFSYDGAGTVSGVNFDDTTLTFTFNLDLDQAAKASNFTDQSGLNAGTATDPSYIVYISNGSAQWGLRLYDGAYTENSVSYEADGVPEIVGHWNDADMMYKQDSNAVTLSELGYSANGGTEQTAAVTATIADQNPSGVALYKGTGVVEDNKVYHQYDLLTTNNSITSIVFNKNYASSITLADIYSKVTVGNSAETWSHDFDISNTTFLEDGNPNKNGVQKYEVLAGDAMLLDGVDANGQKIEKSIVVGSATQLFLQAWKDGGNPDALNVERDIYIGSSTYNGETGAGVKYNNAALRFGNDTTAVGGNVTNISGNIYIVEDAKMISGSTNAINLIGNVTDVVDGADTGSTLTIEGEGYVFKGAVDLSGLVLQSGSAATFSSTSATIGALTTGGTVTNTGSLAVTGKLNLQNAIANSGNLNLSGTTIEIGGHTSLFSKAENDVAGNGFLTGTATVYTNSGESATVSAEIAGVTSGGVTLTADKYTLSGGVLTGNDSDTYWIFNDTDYSKISSAVSSDANKTIRVTAGKTYDIKGSDAYNKVVLETGATFANYGDTVGDVNNNYCNLKQNYYIELAGNANLDASGNFAMVAGEHKCSTLKLNGHTLTKKGTGTVVLNSTVADAGTIAITGGGIVLNEQKDYSALEPEEAKEYISDLDEVAFTMSSGTTLRSIDSMTIKSLSSSGGSITVDSGKKLTVTGKFSVGTGTSQLSGSLKASDLGFNSNGKLTLSNATTVLDLTGKTFNDTSIDANKELVRLMQNTSGAGTVKLASGTVTQTQNAERGDVTIATNYEVGEDSSATLQLTAWGNGTTWRNWIVGKGGSITVGGGEGELNVRAVQQLQIKDGGIVNVGTLKLGHEAKQNPGSINMTGGKLTVSTICGNAQADDANAATPFDNMVSITGGTLKVTGTNALSVRTDSVTEGTNTYTASKMNATIGGSGDSAVTLQTASNDWVLSGDDDSLNGGTLTVGNIIIDAENTKMITISDATISGVITNNATAATAGLTLGDNVTVNGEVKVKGSGTMKMSSLSGTVKVTESAKVQYQNGAVQVAAKSAEGTASVTSAAIADAAVTVGGTADVTLAQALNNADLTYTGANKLTVTGTGSSLSSLTAQGNVDIMSAADTQQLNAITIGAGKTVGIYTGDVAEAITSSESTITTGSLTAGVDSVLNANLVLSDGATVTMADALTMGSDLRLGEGMTLSGDLVNTIKSMSEDGIVDLFTGVDALYLGDSTTVSGALDATSGVNLSMYFDFEGASNYYLGYADKKVFAGIQSVPEPTTATLSLLALAGLAARRRRK